MAISPQNLVSLQRAWGALMSTLAVVNRQRARDARKFDNQLRDLMRRH